MQYELIWIGTSNKTREEFDKYFELDCSYELDDPNYNACGFCKDCGEKWYDEDFLYLEGPLEKEIPIKELIKDAIIADGEYKKIIQKCKELGITKANTMIGLGIGKYNDFHVSKPYKDSYNGLKYMGKFINAYA